MKLYSVLCSVVKVLFLFFVFVNFINVDVCFVLRHRSVVQFCFFLVFSILVILISVLYSVMFSFLHFSFLVMFMSVFCSVMFSFLYFSILLMFFKCSLCMLICERIYLTCECICLFLSSSVVCLFFDTLYLLLFENIFFSSGWKFGKLRKIRFKERNFSNKLTWSFCH